MKMIHKQAASKSRVATFKQWQKSTGEKQISFVLRMMCDFGGWEDINWLVSWSFVSFATRWTWLEALRDQIECKRSKPA